MMTTWNKRIFQSWTDTWPLFFQVVVKKSFQISSLWKLRVVIREKNGIMWEKFPSGGPPPPTPPVWEFSHFFTVFVKLVMPFYKLLNWKKQWKIWSGFGSDPPPQFGNFSHIIPFFVSDNVPYIHCLYYLYFILDSIQCIWQDQNSV